MYQITITNMNTREQQVFTFTEKHRAINNFIERCDARGYDWREMEMHDGYQAGGIGHDYRIELIQQEEEEETTTINPF